MIIGGSGVSHAQAKSLLIRWVGKICVYLLCDLSVVGH